MQQRRISWWSAGIIGYVVSFAIVALLTFATLVFMKNIGWGFIVLYPIYGILASIIGIIISYKIARDSKRKSLTICLLLSLLPFLSYAFISTGIYVPVVTPLLSEFAQLPLLSVMLLVR